MDNTSLFRRISIVGASAIVMAFASAPTLADVMTSGQINAQYDAAMKHCDGLNGNEKDVCKKQAEAQRDSARADAKAGKKKAEAEHDATKEKRDNAYEVEKEKCEAMSGDAEDQCIAKAKTKYGK